MAKRPMTPKERAVYEHEKRKKAVVRRKKRAEFLRYAAKIGIMAVGVAVLFGIAFAISIAFDFSSAPEKYEYSLIITLDGKELEQEKKLAVNDNICYVSMVSMSKIMGFSISGDVNQMYAVFKNGDKLSFIPDTSEYFVNGVARTSNGAAYVTVKDADLYVPISVFNDIFDGLELDRDADGKKVMYTMKISSDFKLAFENNDSLNPVDLSGTFEETEQEIEFLTDFSAYEIYIDPEDRDAYIKLINSSHKLEQSYIPPDLTNISYTRNDGRAVQQMRYDAAMALDAMMMELYANGFTDVTVTSAYRSYKDEKLLFDNTLNSYKKYYDNDTAYAKALAENAEPGASEHQSGLCADLHNLSKATHEFEADAAYKWLTANCDDFGFILRYPKSKQDITGVAFEPWHFRFVGRYHAQKIMRSGLCLEEYCKENGIGLN